MTVRHDIRPRDHSDPGVTEAVRSIQEVVDTIPLVSYRWVRGFVATGTAGSDMPAVAWGPKVDGVLAEASAKPPDVVQVVRVVPVLAATADIAAVGRLNFRVEAAGDVVQYVIPYEPDGLTADTEYDLVLKFVGGVF